LQKDIVAFFNKIEEVYKSKLPFVVYRKPNEKKVIVQAQNSNELVELNSFNEKGFVFAPFNKSDAKILFPLNISEKFSFTFHSFEDIKVESSQPIIHQEKGTSLSKEKYISLVDKVIKSINQFDASKIVVSRKEEINSDGFDVLNSYKKMLKKYENAMVYLWFHPKVGCWMGASPERLIHLNEGVFKTMALAGTQNYLGSLNLNWETKEKQEQKFVTDYILDTIKSTILNIQVSNPYTVKAGNLVHLRTDISGDLNGENSLKNLIDSLHPTPAVCGLPKKEATDFIHKNEGYNRAFYTGYLGELNINSESNLFVNLRCLQLKDKIILIYVGGGITADSIAEKEWDETVFKTEVMKGIL